MKNKGINPNPNRKPNSQMKKIRKKGKEINTTRGYNANNENKEKLYNSYD